MKKEKKPPAPRVPIFDESILTPIGDEVVRAVCTKPNKEAAFEQYCKETGIVCYLPRRRAVKVHNFTQKGIAYNYTHEVLRPMFTSYVFVKISELGLHTLHRSNAIVRILPLQYGQQQFLDEIKVVRTCETVGFQQELEVHKEVLVGKPFLITSGVWEGVRGELVEKDDVCKWTVKIEFCSQYVTTIINPTQFKMIPLDE